MEVQKAVTGGFEQEAIPEEGFLWVGSTFSITRMLKVELQTKEMLRAEPDAKGQLVRQSTERATARECIDRLLSKHHRDVLMASGVIRQNPSLADDPEVRKAGVIACRRLIAMGCPRSAILVAGHLKLTDREICRFD